MEIINIPALKIHELSQEQYKREKEAGRLDNNAIYLTPDEEVQSDWNQNDDTVPDYVKNRTHYVSEGFVTDTIEWYTLSLDLGSGYGTEYRLFFENDNNEKDISYQDVIKELSNCETMYLKFENGDKYKIITISQGDSEWIQAEYLVLENNDKIVISKDSTSNVPGFFPDISDELKILLTTYSTAIIEYTHYSTFVKTLDEKFIPDTIARKDFLEEKVNSLIDAAPEALNTLNELSRALGDDPNFSTTVLTKIGQKVDKVNGKRLSTNDYTTIEKNQLATLNSFFKDLEPIDLFAKFKIRWESISDWPKDDINIVNLFQAQIQ